MGDFMNDRLEKYLENFSSDLDKDKKDELMNSLTYLSNISKQMSPEGKHSSDHKRLMGILRKSKPPKMKELGKLMPGFSTLRTGNKDCTRGIIILNIEQRYQINFCIGKIPKIIKITKNSPDINANRLKLQNVFKFSHARE